MSLKYECQSNWKTKEVEKVVNPKTSKSASIGQILILFHIQITLSIGPFEVPVRSSHQSLKSPKLTTPGQFSAGLSLRFGLI